MKINMDTRLLKVMTAMLLLTAWAEGVMAQRIQTVDKDGQPVAYASVMTEDGKFIGTTDLNGVLEDVKGEPKVVITHVAYQAKTVVVAQGNKVTLVDADFGLPEVTVTRKPLVYVQTYYRMLVTDEKEGLVYYRAGLVDNSFERAKKNLSVDEEHMSMAKSGLIRRLLNMVFNAYKGRLFGLRMSPFEKRAAKRYPELKLEMTPLGNGKTRISDGYGAVGMITEDAAAGLTSISYDSHLLSRHATLARGKEKDIKKLEKSDARMKNRVDVDFEQYRLSDEGVFAPEDFVMSQYFTSYDRDRKEEKDSTHRVMMIQMFNTQRAYVTKDELKALKKQNRMTMDYENIRHFEQAHNIPALAPSIQKFIDQFPVKN